VGGAHTERESTNIDDRMGVAMYAVIHEIESTSTHGLVPIAGRPLVARQIQWLRSARCQGIAVQIGSSAESIALGQWLSRGDAIGTNVRLVMSGKALSPREIARRAGFPDHAPLLAIPADVLCGGDIKAVYAHAHPEGTLVALPAPSALADIFDGSALRVLGPIKMPVSTARQAWAIRVRSLADAFVIGVAVLDGRIARQSENGVLLHAAERERGVWVSRGAHVDPGAKLIAPVLLGADTVIRAGACVGPNVFLGDRSVVARRTRISDSLVAPGTIIGEDLDLSGIAIDARGTQDLFTGEHATIDETLLLAPRDKAHRGNWFGRCLALALVVLFTPIWILLFAKSAASNRRKSASRNQHAGNDLLSLLLQAVRGERFFIGLSDWTDDMPKNVSPALYWKSLTAPLGLIAIDAGLVPENADQATVLRARVYYMHEKNVILDIVLALRCLKRLLVRATRRSVGGDSRKPSSPMRALS